ncbi:MAG: ral secretion pathway protein [Pseudomonadota bacterium]|jgi:general secretion pathway protein C
MGLMDGGQGRCRGLGCRKRSAVPPAVTCPAGRNDDNRATMAIAPLLRKLTTTLVWAACAASAVAWGLKIGGRSLPVPAHAQLLAPEQSLRGDPLRLFSPPAATEAAVAAPAQASRFKLVGVVAPVTASAGIMPVSLRGPATAGVALLSVDGKPARAVRVGAALDANWVLQAVGPRSAELGPANGEPGLHLELPPPPAPATGLLHAAEPAGAMLAPVTQAALPARQPAAIVSAPPATISQPPTAPLVPPAVAEAPPEALRAEGSSDLPPGKMKPGSKR